jgi:hypothetical protein
MFDLLWSASHNCSCVTLKMLFHTVVVGGCEIWLFDWYLLLLMNELEIECYTKFKNGFGALY